MDTHAESSAGQLAQPTTPTSQLVTWTTWSSLPTVIRELTPLSKKMRETAAKRKQQAKGKKGQTAVPELPMELWDDDALRQGHGRFMHTNFLGRRILLVIDGPTGLPVIAVVVPANLVCTLFGRIT